MAKRKLEVEIIGDADSLVRALGKSGAATDKFGRQTQSAGSRVGGVFSGITKRAVGMAGAVAGAYASIEGAKKAIDVTEDLGHTTLTLHKNFGLSIKSASEWGAVAKARGVDGTKLATSFKALATATHNAVTGSKAQVLAFKGLGISTKDLTKHGDDTNYMLHRVSDGLGKLPAGTNKAALMAKLFGRTWTTLAPLIRGGSKSMDEQLAVAEKYGATLGGHSIKSIEDFAKAQRESKLATMGLQVTLGTTLIPWLTKGIGAFARFVAQMRSGTGVGGKVASVLGKVGAVIKVVFNAIKSAVTTAIPVLVNGFNTAKNAVVGWVHANSAQIKQVLQAFKNVATGIAAVLSVGFRAAKAVVMAVMPGIAAVVKGSLKIISGVIKVFSGLLTGDFGGAWRGLKKIASGAMQALVGIVRTIGAQVAVAVKGVAKAMAAALRWGVGAFFNIGIDMLKGLAHGIASAAKSVYDAAKNVVKGAVDGVKSFLGINSPSRLFHGFGWSVGEGFSNGLKASKAKVRSGLVAGLLFPIDEAITKLGEQRDKLQAAFDKVDSKRERKSLVSDLHAARHAGTTSGGGGVSVKGGATSTSGRSDIIRTVLGVGKAKGASKSMLLAALEAGLQESGFNPNSVGDGGKAVGIFQEWPDKGSVAHRKNPTASANWWFNYAKGIKGSSKMDPAALAQAVERSANPAGYAPHAAQAAALLRQYSGGGGKTGTKSSGGSSGDVKSALAALKDFDRETARAKKLAAIDLKVKGLEQLKAYKDAIAGLKDKLKDLATQAASTWRAAQEKSINATHDATVAGLADSADSQELARLQKQDADEDDAKQTAQLNQDLADAIKAGDVKAQADAQDAIDVYARQKREEALTASIQAATDSADSTRDVALNALDQQEQDYAASLQTQFDALTGNLEARKSTYADWAKSVNAILSTYGLGVDVSSDDEAAVNAGPTAPPPSNVNTTAQAASGIGGWRRRLPHRAGGGPVTTGQSYWVGEMGPEKFTPRTPGTIAPASQSKGRGGATVLMTGPVTIGSNRAAEKLAHTLAHRMRYG